MDCTHDQAPSAKSSPETTDSAVTGLYGAAAEGRERCPLGNDANRRPPGSLAPLTKWQFAKRWLVRSRIPKRPRNVYLGSRTHPGKAALTEPAHMLRGVGGAKRGNRADVPRPH